MKTKFTDPRSYPTVFAPQEREVIVMGIKEFPVSFAVSPDPRPATIESFAIKQLDTFFIEKDIYKDDRVALFDKNVFHSIELLATNKNIFETNFSLKFDLNSDESKSIATGGIQTINQPTGNLTDINHIFVMSDSTKNFDVWVDEGTDKYATVYLKLFFYPYVENTSYVWGDLILPDKQNTSVTIAPIGCYGILDILVHVDVKWYLDPERTISATAPERIWGNFKFGMRFCISNKGSLFKNEVMIGLTGVAIVPLYSSTTLKSFDLSAYHKIFYWVTGERKDDLFCGDVNQIEIADNGLPIQLSKETAVYLLDNPLVDIYSSSSSSISSISSSSLSTSSISSLNSSSSSSSSTSSSSSSLTSSLSSSSPSSSSSSSISSSSTISLSSQSSLSSSTSVARAYSSSSSLSSSTEIYGYSSSSSSVVSKMILYYGFETIYDEFGHIIDESGNQHIAGVKMSNPPAWSTADGIYGGKYLFSPSGSGLESTQYIISTNTSGYSSLSKGTLSLWTKLTSLSLSISSTLFSITNGFETNKTEFILGFSITNIKEIIAAIVVDGEYKWVLNASLLENFVGDWTNIVVIHNGSEPSLYVNGLLYPFTFSIPDYKSFWIGSLFDYGVNSKANKLMIGATTRNYYPYNVLGFAGDIDEIKIWDINMTAAFINEEYHKLKP